MESFSSRQEAGKLLADALSAYKGRKDVLVLALPRGGVPVGVEIAKALDLPMDLMLVRKLGVPGQEELAMGALAANDVRFLNEDLIRQIGISEDELEAAIARESKELRRRNDVYRDGRPFPDLKNRTVILVDDGIATGADMRAAVRAARELGALRVTVAVPVSADTAYSMLEREADEVISLLVPSIFYGVGAFYDDFSQMVDEEVMALMAAVSP
ncbi:MAG: phosphoribosyltransferase [Alphaproteobacteria bacterium]|nr:phosphoribosyltransferase [Alphaproteobacteria bacterium]